MIKSPLRYPGGKTRAIKYLKKFIPEFSELREPFLGGASFSFYTSQAFRNKIITTSDLNYELYCFWKILKENPIELVSIVQNIFDQKWNGRELFTTLVARRNNNLSELERAVDFFILNRITFSGVVDAGGYSQESFEKRFTQSSIDRLAIAYEVIRNFTVLNDDYNALLRKKGKDVFIFLDPPYYSATSSKLYGKNGILHEQFDHIEFFKSVALCKHKWLITYDNSDYVRDLYRNFYQVEWELQYGMNNYKKSSAAKGKELLIANYDILKLDVGLGH
ncbi:MAG: DNA adenine methylase [Bacteroidetes bacterium]|nr:DNA adenine methylase [Bacteroidota bacterium]